MYHQIRAAGGTWSGFQPLGGTVTTWRLPTGPGVRVDGAVKVGSGVYELSTQTVAGILVRGETDYVANGSCNVVNVCGETGCRGEDVTYVYPALVGFCRATNLT